MARYQIKISRFKTSFDRKLQTNKVKYVIPLFDIHSLDNLKLAERFLKSRKRQQELKIFIQVNIGGEIQKNGINSADLKNFYDKCVNDLNLNIIGLMRIPPQSDNSNLYFKEMFKLKNSIGLQHLSMGMSSDYIEAVEHGASFVRIDLRYSVIELNYLNFVFY